MERLRYLTLRAAFWAANKIRGRLTPAGWTVLGGWALSAAFALDPNRSAAYQAFGFLSVLWAAAFLGLLFFRPRLVIERIFPRYASAGEEFRYQVFARGPLDGSDVSLMERIRSSPPSFERFKAARGVFDDSRTIVERFSGFGRWRALERRTRGRSEAAALPAIIPESSVSFENRLRPGARGRLEIEGAVLLRTEPFGLLRAASFISAPASVLVLPRRYPVAAAALPGSRRLRSGDEALASEIGESSEFIGLREYRPGDPLRRIDWKSWAKTERPIVREHRDENFVRHALILDNFVSASRREHFEEAVSAAASFAASLETRESLIDLLFVADRAVCVTAGRGLGSTDGLLETLAGALPAPGGDFGVLTAAVLSRIHMLSGAVVILTAYDEKRKELLSRLSGVGVPLRAYVVLSPGEDPDAPWGDSLRRLELGKLGEGLLAR